MPRVWSPEFGYRASEFAYRASEFAYRASLARKAVPTEELVGASSWQIGLDPRSVFGFAYFDQQNRRS
jgi:hypothetical protein